MARARRLGTKCSKGAWRGMRMNRWEGIRAQVLLPFHPFVLCSFTLVPFYLCTHSSMSLHPFTSAPQCLSPVYFFTIAPFSPKCPYTLAPSCPFNWAPYYLYTLKPFHFCALSPLPPFSYAPLILMSHPKKCNVTKVSQQCWLIAIWRCHNVSDVILEGSKIAVRALSLEEFFSI